MTQPKVLVVDDEPYMHVLMQHHLLRAGYAVLKAANGREALAVAAREHPALIIMDFMMEEMDGLAAMQELKKDAGTSDIPVIILTANANYVTRQQAESSGAALFLNKPFSPTQLMQEIKRLAPVVSGN
jgi:CheY-like chemotaxis protein